MTKLLLKTSDQLLSLVSCKQPTLASGNVGSIQLSVDLCNEWVGYTTSAIFFTVKKHEEVYEQLLVSNTCKIPKEVLVDADCVYIGLRGVNIKDPAVIKTSGLIKIKISKGAPEGTAEIIEPTSSVYQQLMAAYGEKINLPKDEDGNISYGLKDQILASNGDCTTKWISQISSGVSDEQIEMAINNYFEENDIDYSSILERLENLEYVEISVSSFNHSVMDTENVGKSTVEIGSTVKSVMLAWEFNKPATSITIDDMPVNLEGVERFGTLTQINLNLTSDKTWTLKITDERGVVATKTTKLSFLNGVYYGIGGTNEDIDDYDTFILNLTNKTLTNTKGRTINVVAGVDEYIYYCYPARLGLDINFNVGGFDGGFEFVTAVTFTNASGYTEMYFVFKSTNANLGSTTVKIS